MGNAIRFSKLRFVIAGAISLVAGTAQATERYEFYTGARQLGMGGAYTAVVNDETALLTNPAGLGKVRDFIWTIADPEVHGSFNDTEITKIDNFTKAMNAKELRELLKEHPGKHWHAKAQAFPSLLAPNVGFGIHAKSSYDAEISADGTNYRLDYTNDYAAVLGFCFRFFGGIIKLGATARYMNRTEIHKDLDPNAEEVDYNIEASEGGGLAADAGLILSAPVAWLPSIAAVARDIGDTTYTHTSGMFYKTTTRPAPTQQTLDVGLALFPIMSNHSRMTITVDYHDALNVAKDEDPMKRVHAGVEFNFADFFFLRGGMNQRYWTGGFEFATESFQLQGASYGEEIGTATAFREDRRWVGKFAIRF